MLTLSRSLGLEAKIWILSGCVAVAAALAYVTLVAPIGTEPSTLDVPWWLVAAGFAAAERWVVHLHFRRSTHSLSLGELPLVAGLLFLPAEELVIAGLVGSSVALAFDREIPTFKAFFNLAQFTLGTCVALFVVIGLVGVRDPLDPVVWLAVFAAVSAATLVADICVGAAVTIAEGRLEPEQRIDMLLTNWTVALSNTCLALAIAAVVAARPEGGLLLVPPTVLLMAAYRAYLSERRRNSELEFLYEATRTLSRSSEIVPELEALLARTASAFRVDAVDLVLFSAEPNRSARSSLNRDGSRRMLEPIEEPLAESLRCLAAGLTGPIEADRIQDPSQREYLRGRGMECGVVAPLHGEAGCVGLFAIAGRESVDRSFSEEDLRLLETLTGNVTVALQYDRLEQAVRQLESLQQELERKALYDSLTQLANRSLFHNRLEHALQSRRPGICVLLLDIDEFKAVNDSHGHHAGDELLRAVADRLRACLREGDTAARLGGDEFALLLDRSEGEVDAVAVARRLLDDFDARIDVAGERIRVHVSIGIAVGTPGKDGPDEMLRKADVALYEAKRRGKNQHRVFHPSMRDALRKRRTLAFELERAVSDEELAVVYQPVVSLQDSRAVALEALVRWNHPERGLVAPGEFIAFAEETGAVVEIGALVLERVIEQAARAAHADPRERLRARADRPGLPRPARRADRHPPAPAGAAHLRAHRARLRRGRPRAAGRARGAPRARHGCRGRRLRHRLLVARLPVAPPGRHDEDPEAVHRRRDRLARAPRACPRGDRARRGARPEGDRRGHRDAGADRRAARVRLRLRPGLLLRHADRRGAGAPPRRPAAREPAVAAALRAV